jgi:hypothetical protein
MLSALLYQSTELGIVAEVLVHFSKVMRGFAILLEVNVSFLVIFVCGTRTVLA